MLRGETRSRSVAETSVVVQQLAVKTVGVREGRKIGRKSKGVVSENNGNRQAVHQKPVISATVIRAISRESGVFKMAWLANIIVLSM